MMITLRTGQLVEIRLINETDKDPLYHYFQNLSPSTRSRYQPHSFDRQTVNEICDSLCREVLRYIAVEKNSSQIIAYMLVKSGVLEGEKLRYTQTGINLDETTSCTFAPSVADEWQNTGLGSSMYIQIENDLKKNTPFKTVVLWGGVQSSNRRAVHFYEKHGFRLIQSFWHNDMENLDMMKSW